jgi:hypothetical protein
MIKNAISSDIDPGPASIGMAKVSAISFLFEHHFHSFIYPLFLLKLPVRRENQMLQ